MENNKEALLLKSFTKVIHLSNSNIINSIEIRGRLTENQGKINGKIIGKLKGNYWKIEGKLIKKFW